MRFFLLAVAAQAFSVQKPEAALLQEFAGAKLETGTGTVLSMLTDMLDNTKQALTDKQGELATKRSDCDTETGKRKKEIESHTSQKAQVQAEYTALNAKEGAYDAKCDQLEKRKDDSAQAKSDANNANNAEKTAEYNEQVLECNTLQSAMTVLTNKQSALQTGTEAMVQTMSKDMKDKLYDVVSRETNVVDADTVMLAISKSTYSSQVGQAGGFGTIVGIIMGLHNHALEARDRIAIELEQLNDHLAERKSLTTQIATSDLGQFDTCLNEQKAIVSYREDSGHELERVTTDLSNAVSSLSDTSRTCNDVISEHTAFIVNHKETVATVTEVLAILDHTFATTAVFLQTDADGPAHARTDQSFSRVCTMLDKMREETERKRATFMRERKDCENIMPKMVLVINKLDSKIDDAHWKASVHNTEVRGSMADGHSSLNYQIEEKLPQEVISEKVLLQQQSNARKADSEQNAADIATNQRYIAECRDANQKLAKITNFKANNDSGGDSIGQIISMINNLITGAEGAIEIATNNEKINHADYMNNVAGTNSAISLLMDEIAEKKGKRAARLKDEASLKARLQKLITEQHNLGINFMATCKVYGVTTYVPEDGILNGADDGADANDADGHASWSEFKTGNLDGDSLTNDDKFNRFGQLEAELGNLSGRLTCVANAR